MACCTLFVSMEGSRWWGITFLGEVGMEREGKGTEGNLFRGLAAFCTPFFASGELRWWERIFQGAVDFLVMYNLVRVGIEELFSG